MLCRSHVTPPGAGHRASLAQLPGVSQGCVDFNFRRHLAAIRHISWWEDRFYRSWVPSVILGLRIPGDIRSF